MDFITGLPEVSDEYGQPVDVLLVIVYRYSKIILLTLCLKSLNAIGFTKILYKEVDSRFGTP